MKCRHSSVRLAPATLCAVTIAMLAGCAGSGATSTGTSSTPAPADVYAAGIEVVGTQTKAAVWKNGTETVLDSGSYSARANGVAVAAGHVYVVGAEGNSAGQNVPVIWDNGVAAQVPIAGTFGSANGVVALGSDVYIVGDDATPTTTPGVNFYRGALWKDGVESLLADNGYGSTASAVTTDGADIYVGGTAQTIVSGAGGGTILTQAAAYWKNGTLTVLNSGSTVAVVTGIAVGNAHVYLAGGLCNLQGNTTCPTVASWQDTSTFPQTPSVYGLATGVALSGSNVYMSENLYPATTAAANDPVLVTNGSLTTLSVTVGAAANCVLTNNGDVYVGGSINRAPTYWKNGQPVTLTATASIAALTSMAVVPAGT